MTHPLSEELRALADSGDICKADTDLVRRAADALDDVTRKWHGANVLLNGKVGSLEAERDELRRQLNAAHSIHDTFAKAHLLKLKNAEAQVRELKDKNEAWIRTAAAKQAQAARYQKLYEDCINANKSGPSPGDENRKD